ncbi:hypothetical protein MRB53_037066 [Persea americana]|nr:hypothetical protein MRB53_037066 [Persea americana]
MTKAEAPSPVVVMYVDERSGVEEKRGRISWCTRHLGSATGNAAEDKRYDYPVTSCEGKQVQTPTRDFITRLRHAKTKSLIQSSTIPELPTSLDLPTCNDRLLTQTSAGQQQRRATPLFKQTRLCFAVMLSRVARPAARAGAAASLARCVAPLTLALPTACTSQLQLADDTSQDRTGKRQLCDSS